MAKKTKKPLSVDELEFVDALNSAVLQVTPRKFRVTLFISILIPIIFIVWANYALIDEIVRGNGEIIPSGENQMIQNLEGGIVEEIFINEGDNVKKGEVLLKINNEKSKSSYSSNSIKVDAIKAKIVRLKAEAFLEEFLAPLDLLEKIPEFIENERSLYLVNQKQLNSKIDGLKNRLAQKKQQYIEAKAQEINLKSSLQIITKEVEMSEPMVIKGVKSKIDFLKLQREENELKDRYSSAKNAIPKIEFEIKEINDNIKEVKFQFQSEAKVRLNEALAELKSMEADVVALEDQVDRTLVRSSMDGVIQKLFVNTIGGVIRPGANIVEIVPSGQRLLVEVKIKPSDIAFIFLEQKAIVKFSAYDFSVYGALDGKVIYISPDTIKDENGNIYYTLKIKTNKSYLEREEKKLKIIPGMTVSVDIITGRKSVLDYILKPILKTKQYTFTER
ncbi:MAG: HlyD family type I secretion periplasmic adaptor subunit [Campylobacterales bacterium]|nr:HlyD family type I secretion periplasmic adaptor subunit [Campylobacterales bacterium]